MADLILKFFQEDLTEAEQQALSDGIWASEEQAMRLSEEAARAYQRYGLPEPEWTGGGPPRRHWPKAGFNPWPWFSAILAVGLAAWALWHYRARMEKVIPGASWIGRLFVSERFPGPGASIPPKVISGAGGPKSAPDSVIPKTINPASQERAHLAGSTGSISPEAGGEEPHNPPSGSPQMTPVLTPVDTAAYPHRAHSNLSVMVRRAEPGQVTLRLFDVDDQQVLLLYQGLLQAGNWAFDWDGKLGNKPAPPGYYQIQVESGAVTQRKKIFIR